MKIKKPNENSDFQPSNPAKITFKNIRKFLQGWKRYIIYKLCYRNLLLNRLTDNVISLLPNHKLEQFEWRLTVIDSECLANKACKICGCEIPQLQMADEACEGNCYPKMMNKEDWVKFKKDNYVKI